MARFEEIIRGPSYGIGARCLIWALIASSFTLFFGGNLWDAAAAAVVGGLCTWPRSASTASTSTGYSPIS